MKFIKGVFFNKREGSPDFVVGTVSIKIEDFLQSYEEWVNDKGYINIEVLTGKDGKVYIKPNDFGLKNASNEINTDTLNF